MPDESNRTLSHYRLVDKIGEGGMGEVWKAVDTKLDREVAIKLLSDSFASDPLRVARFEREAKAIAALSHPNIVTIYSTEMTEGKHYFTMELVRGKTLAEMIPESGMPPKGVFELAIPMCQAVSAAHQRGIVHGDLKPRNVMVTDDGQVKILDFGLARSLANASVSAVSDDSTDTVSDVGSISGTMPYMSPEQIQGKDLDHRSDIFSLGIVLYEMASGRRPFGGGTLADVIASILKDKPRPVTELNRELPRHLERIIRRCLEKDPERRLQSTLDLCNELEALDREMGVAASETVPSIAVLPFADMSSEKDQEYFCVGIAEEIINALSKIKELRVVSRTSSFRFKDEATDSREIGDRLGVSTLLEGSVRKADDRLRITTELINVGDGYHLWSEKYDRELKDVFAIQDEIAQSIARALEVELSPRERRAIKQVATADVRAYDYYLRGRNFFYQYRRRGIEFALQMFERAIEIDPAYALAYAGIADGRSFLYMNTDHIEEHREEAEAASRKALALDPELAEAHAARGVALSLSRRHDEAKQAFETAIYLNRSLFEAPYFYARDCFIQRKFQEAIRLYRQASKLRPEDHQSPLLVAQVYEALGRVDEAAESRRRGVRLARERLDTNPDDVRALYLGANGLVALGECDEGLEWAERALMIEPDEPMLLYNLACIYALAGVADDALDCLERAIDHGFAHKPWMELDRDLDALRDHPRFAVLMESF